MSIFTPGTVDIAIIGTAGRDRAWSSRMNRALYFAMFADALERIQTIAQGLPIRLISGGAAWSDHLAVNLFLKGHAAQLTLRLPAVFQREVPGYRAVSDNQYDPGSVSNYYHRLFSRAVEHDSLADIAEALARPGAESSVHDGFKARNRVVAQEAEWLLAYTWGAGDTPADGGTLHTWNACRIPLSRRTHISLQLLSVPGPGDF